MKLPLTLASWLCLAALASATPTNGLASWYGEAHRGKLMANGKRFNPDRLTAASWFYPLGTKVKVTLQTRSGATRSVLVTITDRGPSTDLVREGRIIDLAYAAFKRLGEPDVGLVPVTVRPVESERRQIPDRKMQNAKASDAAAQGACPSRARPRDPSPGTATFGLAEGTG